MDIQSRTAEYGVGRHHAHAEIEARCLTPLLADAKNGGITPQDHWLTLENRIGLLGFNESTIGKTVAKQTNRYRNACFLKHCVCGND